MGYYPLLFSFYQGYFWGTWLAFTLLFFCWLFGWL